MNWLITLLFHTASLHSFYIHTWLIDYLKTFPLVLYRFLVLFIIICLLNVSKTKVVKTMSSQLWFFKQVSHKNFTWTSGRNRQSARYLHNLQPEPTIQTLVDLGPSRNDEVHTILQWPSKCTQALGSSPWRINFYLLQIKYMKWSSSLKIKTN